MDLQHQQHSTGLKKLQGNWDAFPLLITLSHSHSLTLHSMRISSHSQLKQHIVSLYHTKCFHLVSHHSGSQVHQCLHHTTEQITETLSHILNVHMHTKGFTRNDRRVELIAKDMSKYHSCVIPSMLHPCDNPFTHL